MSNDEKNSYKIYGIKPHTLSVEPLDDFRYQILFDEYLIASSWNFNKEPLEKFIEAITFDKIFARRWEEYFSKYKTDEKSQLFELITDNNDLKTIDDDSIERMNGFISAGLPPGLAAFLMLIDLDQENPLTVDDVAWIQQTGAVIQLAPSTYESTLEIVAILNREWNQKAVKDVLSNFGETLIQQQEIFKILSKVPPQTAASIVEMNAPMVHFLKTFSLDINDFNYRVEEIDLLLQLINKIQTEDAYAIDQIKETWEKIINNNYLLSKPISDMTQKEKKTKKEIEDNLTFFNVQEMSFTTYTSLANLYRKLFDRTALSRYLGEHTAECAGVIFAAMIFVYGVESIERTMNNHSESNYTFFQYLTFIDYEKDGMIADSNLILSLFGLDKF